MPKQNILQPFFLLLYICYSIFGYFTPRLRHILQLSKSGILTKKLRHAFCRRSSCSRPASKPNSFLLKIPNIRNNERNFISSWLLFPRALFFLQKRKSQSHILQFIQVRYFTPRLRHAFCHKAAFLFAKLVTSISFMFLFSVTALAKDYPYEKCSWKNKQMTERMIQESTGQSDSKTEAEALCIECESKKQSQKIAGESNAALTSHDVKMLYNTASKTNDIPKICFLASSLQTASGTKMWSPKNVGYYYCPTANTHKRRSYMRFDKKPKSLIDDETELKKSCGKQCFELLAQRVCISEDYIDMTAKAFNETANCFGYHSKKDKEQLFALMNHESRFSLNKKPKGNKSARCYGQIQNNAIIDINSYIKYGNPNGKPSVKSFKKYYQVYKDLMNKPECAFLENKRVQFPKFKYKKGQKFTNKHVKLEFIKDEKIGDTIQPLDQYKLYSMQKHPQGYAIKCKTSQDAYSCLFYTLFNTKRNEIDLQARLAKNEASPTTAELIKYSNKHKKIAKDFKTPIKLNEMLIVEGVITKNGRKKKTGKLIIKSMDELFHIFGKSSMQYDLKDLKIKKVKLFDNRSNSSDDSLKWAFMHLTHNGGLSVAKSHFENFMHALKDAISSDNKDSTSYRNQILSGQALDMGQLVKAFEHYANLIKKPNIAFEDKTQLINFLSNIQTDLTALHSKEKIRTHINGGGKTPGMKLVDAFKDNKKQKIDRFAKQVNKSCPKSIF